MEVNEETVSFEERVKEEFGSAFRATSERDDFDFPVVIQHVDKDEEGREVALLFPSPFKNFRLVITGVEEQESKWIVNTTDQRWSFRELEPEDDETFVKAMREEGFDA